MRHKIVFSAILLLIAAAPGARAADISHYEPAPTPAPGFSWAGGYLGGQLGWGWGSAKVSDHYDGGATLKPGGFLGGLYAGYNFDVGDNVVLGVDGDVTYNGLTDDRVEDDAYLRSTLRWSGAARLRAGYAVDRFLPYVAGGVAFGGVKTSIGDQLGHASETRTQTGWTIGAGVDYAATENVVLRLEYRYTDYGHKSYTLGFDDGLRGRLSVNDIRMGVAYKF